MDYEPLFFYDCFDDRKTLAPRWYRGGILTMEQWDKLCEAVNGFYERVGGDEWVKQYNSPEASRKRQEEYMRENEERSKRIDAESKQRAIEQRKKFFYIGKITKTTPDPITKIGIAQDKSRMKYYEDTYGENWKLIGMWFLRDAITFEKDMRDMFKSKAITTGKDFFYLTDPEICTVCEMAESIAIARR